MEYQYKVIISNRTVYKEFEIQPDMDRVKLGTGSSCEFRLNPEAFFTGIEMEFRKNGKSWNLECSDDVYFSRGDMRKLLSTEVRHGDVLSVCYASTGNEAFELRFLIDFEARVPDYNYYLEITGTIDIATDATADIILNSKFSNDSKIRLTLNGTQCQLEEIVSEYGVYLNGRKLMNKTELKDSDFFSVAEFHFYYKDRKIFFDRENLKVANGEMKEVSTHTNNFHYPLFNRNTRIKKQLSDEKIEILDAPAIPKKPENNIVLTLMPTVAMLALMIVVRGVMNTSGGSYIIFSICSMGLGIVTSILGFVSGRKQYKRECAERIRKYTNYIEKKKLEVATERQEELDSLNEMYCNVQQDIDTAMHFDRRLFEKTREDEDFLHIYLGQGTIASSRPIDYKKQERLEVGDELTEMPEKIYQLFEHIDGAPICSDMKDSNAIGIVGTKEALYGMFKNIVIDIAVRHYYGDVRLYMLVDDEKRYQWARFLPHLMNAGGIRNIVFDNESKNNIFESLFRELTYREQTEEIPYYGIVLVENEFGIKNHPISRYIEQASELGMTFVFFENSAEELPLHCDEIIELHSESEGVICKAEDGNQIKQFEYHTITDKQAADVAEKLAPVYCEEISLENSLRKNITLYELLHIFTVEDLNLAQRWQESQIFKSMAAPLGVNAKDEIVTLNLHEKAHGPHGLVAGTTGSGKSEILQSYILSAATIFHPYEIGFVIIDFKGGGMVNQFRDLPHLIGAITNIDGNEVQRSLKSIKAELMKRQNLFAEAGVNHIDKYIELYKEKRVTVALPHLVIIVDEFAELKAEEPDFMKELISAARIGRSLGVHLILATQKPSGVVDGQIWSNSKFKLCLKVQSKEDSNEVLKTPLAAEIKEPGRAYLQVGNNEIFELFQSAYSGAPATMEDTEGSKEFQISQLNFAGMRKVVYQKKKEKRKDAHNKNQLEAIVEYIAAYCKKEHITKLPDICMPPLPEILYYIDSARRDTEEIYATVGLLDDPDRQLQEALNLNVTSQNYMIIGSAQCGKTNVLQTIIRSIAGNYAPSEVNMYMIDFGSMILKNFAELNHCGGVVCVSDDEKLKNLFKLLNTEVKNRKERFAEAGVSSFVAYKETGKTDLPQIIVFIDNLTALKEMYLQDQDYLLPLCRDGIAVGISFVVANAQTSGIGYRYLNNFEGRITLFCNETSEYGMMFEGCRMKLPDIPGRSLVQINKNIFECQMYLSFEGEKEFERVQEIRKFVEMQNGKYAGQKARVIPEIPKELNAEYIQKVYPSYQKQGSVVLGLDYNTVLPDAIDFTSGGMLTLSGKKEKGKDIFAKYFIESVLQNGFGEAELYILDDMTRKWGEYEFHPKTALYVNTSETLQTVIDEIDQRVQMRYEQFSEGQLDVLEDEPWIVLIIESADAIADISGNKQEIAAIRSWLGKYRTMKIFILMTNVENANIAFNAPELLKVVKDNRRYLIFEDAANIKMCDISISVAKKYAKPIEPCDAFYICENELTKLKTVKLS